MSVEMKKSRKRVVKWFEELRIKMKEMKKDL
jgi:hypothetical protein